MYYHVIYAKLKCDSCKTTIDLKPNDLKAPKDWTTLLCINRTPTGRRKKRGGWVETQFCPKCSKKHTREELYEIGNKLMLAYAIKRHKSKTQPAATS